MREQPAFPVVDPDGPTHTGMTLRDYFAAKALPAVIAAVPNGTGLGVSHPKNTLGVARVAYALADAMLKARDEVKP
mgnify:CR=1 FL=1